MADEENSRIGAIDVLEHEQPLCALRAIDCSDRLVVLDAIVTLQSRISGEKYGISRF